MKIALLSITVLTLSFTTSCGQTTTEIVDEIAERNLVEHEIVGFSAQRSENYKNFEKLKKTANLFSLVELTAHRNSVVSCYAAWALIDKGYSDLPSIFSQFLKTDRSVETFSGCIMSTDNLSSSFYSRFWHQTKDKKGNQILQTLDSLIIYDNRPGWHLLERALKNRLYPRRYNQRIATLAFEEGYTDAISYLSNWYKAEYKEEIQQVLIKRLLNTEFSNLDVNIYYETVAELLDHNDDNIKQVVMEKLRDDRNWENDKEKFLILFKQHSIHERMLYKSP